MESAYRVVLTLEVYDSIRKWPKENRIELDAIQRLLVAEGPAGLDWSAWDLAGFPDWEVIEKPVVRVFHTAFEERVYRLTLEMVPGRTIVVRKAEHFISLFWR